MMRAAAALVVVGLLVQSPTALACGPFYPETGSPLVSPYTQLEVIVADFDGTVMVEKPEFRFLYPFRKAYPGQVDEIWRMAYGRGTGTVASDDSQTAPSGDGQTALLVDAHLRRFASVLRSGSLDAAAKEARAITDTVLDTPPSIAASHQAALRRAVEFLELRRSFAGLAPALVHRFFMEDPLLDPASLPPALRDALALRGFDRERAEELTKAHTSSLRLASLQFVALQNAVKRDIPNGWRGEIQKKMTSDGWARLERLHDDWLRAYPDHPLADLVRLSKVRIYFLKGDANRAWETLFAVYPRHLPRVLWEMRYLLGQDTVPNAKVIDSADPVLRTAFVSVRNLDASAWTVHWKLAEANLPKPWAVNLQERLLSEAVALTAGGKGLPASFPDRPLNPTPLWAKLRLAALLQAGRLDEATEQASSIRIEPDIAPLVSRLYVLRGQWAKAISVDGLETPTWQYMLRVLAPEPALAELASTGQEGPLRREAQLALAIRRAAKDGWAAGANLLERSDPARAVLWRKAGTLAADSSLAGRLALARFLAANHGNLFYERDLDWTRTVGGHIAGINERLRQEKEDSTERDADEAGLPWTPEQEREALRGYVTTGMELFRAFAAYAAWFEAAGPRHRDARALLREADQAFNRLVNLEGLGGRHWIELLEDTDAVKIVRRIGRETRAR